VPSNEAPSSAVDVTPVWGDQIAVEQLLGVPFRMYSARPRHVIEVLALAHRWAARPYVIQGTREVGFDALLRGIERKAKALAELGVTTGGRVLILGWSSPDWMINFWACQSLGAVPALANAWWSEVEVSDALTLLNPVVTLADDRSAAKVPAGADRGPWHTNTSLDELLADDSLSAQHEAGDEQRPAVIIFTSGTAGRPKAVEISHRALLANLQMMLQVTHRLPHEVGDDAGEVTLHTGPLFHVGGPQMLLRSIAVGNTMILPAGRFDPAEVLALIERHEVTRWAVSPRWSPACSIIRIWGAGTCTACAR
jgi:acyl-CoA synthetase (AMP-forming)/AMP-acid ligase II